MKDEKIKALAVEANKELTLDNKGGRLFAGKKEFAAEYVYYHAMREGRAYSISDQNERINNIRSITKAMK